MKKQVKLKATETVATNSDFYNLFRPIVPSIDVIGKVAQVVSGLTEAVTIWYITQSEMADVSKGISIAISIVAMILVVAILELGGRKFLQVLTRTIVWKRLENTWYVALFTIVAAITIGMAVLSFRLSTNGVHHAFVSNVSVAETYDASKLKQEFRASSDAIATRFKNDLEVIETNHKEVVTSTRDQFNARIKTYEVKAETYDAKFKDGHDWAKSQADKYRKTAASLETEKTAAIMKLQSTFASKIDKHQKRKNDAIDKEKSEISQSIKKGEMAMLAQHDFKFKNAEFWGSLFSFFVGFSVLLAFICIISVEVFRRGSGIKVEYEEVDHDQPITTIFWKGLQTRFGGFFRRKAENFARITSPNLNDGRGKIGFNYRDRMATNQVDNLPTSSDQNHEVR